jgi:hypothetical protein
VLYGTAAANSQLVGMMELDLDAAKLPSRSPSWFLGWFRRQVHQTALGQSNLQALFAVCNCAAKGGSVILQTNERPFYSL